ncbi:hypothetical protein GCM10027452_39850 [Micromonospora halotolerans]
MPGDRAGRLDHLHVDVGAVRHLQRVRRVVAQLAEDLVGVGIRGVGLEAADQDPLAHHPGGEPGGGHTERRADHPGDPAGGGPRPGNPEPLTHGRSPS